MYLKMAMIIFLALFWAILAGIATHNLLVGGGVFLFGLVMGLVLFGLFLMAEYDPIK